jgi:membrane fusion protein (multidrug efflux system)
VLRPGQYAKVRARMRTAQKALLVPQRAVSEIQGTYQVAVVGPNNTVEVRPVQVGEQIGQEWIVTEGLKSGERVVAEGIQKVKPGATVTPRPYVPEEPPAGPQANPAAGPSQDAPGAPATTGRKG